MDIKALVASGGALAAVSAGAVSQFWNPDADAALAFPPVAAFEAPISADLHAEEDESDARDALVFCFPGVIQSETGCLTRERLLQMNDQPHQRRATEEASTPMAIVMAHPEDFLLPQERVDSCARYGEVRADGWGPMTSAGMAQEAHFVRYCGLLSLGRLAREYRISYFSAGGMTEAELATIPQTDWPVFGEDFQDTPILQQSEEDSGLWSIESVVMTGTVRDVVVADFDDDGDAERLIYVAVRVRGGSAGYATYALLDPEGEGQVIRLRRVDLQ